MTDEEFVNDKGSCWVLQYKLGDTWDDWQSYNKEVAPERAISLMEAWAKVKKTVLFRLSRLINGKVEFYCDR